MKQFALILILVALCSINALAQTETPLADSTVSENSLIKSTINLNPPLYIFDDVEISDKEFKNIDETKLESIRVIKDSASLAKYGTKGQHGVVIITSRKPTLKIKDSKKIE